VKFLLVIPDGVGVRNFLCTNFIDLLLKSGDVVIWHALPEISIESHRSRWNGRVYWRALPRVREGLVERTLRRAKLYAQIYWKKDQGNDLMLERMRPGRGWINRSTGCAARFLGFLSAGPGRIVWLDRLHELSVAYGSHQAEFERFLNHERPDVMFCTHQRASSAVPAVVAARGLKIPTATFVYSWDNLPKGRMAVRADHFIVWSDHMKNQLLSYYPEVSADCVWVVGTPQFEHYFDEALSVSREEFFRRAGLDCSRPVVCFSGDDVTTSPYDASYLADLAESLRKAPGPERPQILFRRCPVDASKRYQSVLAKYPEIVVSDPVWISDHARDWSGVIPLVEDVALLVNVVRHCDVVVNVGSTMAMDFAILDKPGIYLAYNPREADMNKGWNVHDLYRLPHFRSVHELQPVHWAYEAEDLAAAITQVLSNPQEKSRARGLWLNKHAKHPLDQASERCYEALREIVEMSDASTINLAPTCSMMESST
jgi:hypothetical protein